MVKNKLCSDIQTVHGYSEREYGSIEISNTNEMTSKVVVFLRRTAENLVTVMQAQGKRNSPPPPHTPHPITFICICTCT